MHPKLDNQLQCLGIAGRAAFGPVAAICCLLMMCSVSFGDGDNPTQTDLIKAGDFEGEAVGFPPFRGRQKNRFGNDGCIYCGPSTDDAFRGKQSCKIQTTGTRGDCLRYMCTQVEAGKAYRYEFHYKIKFGGIVINYEGGLPQTFRLAGPTEGWKKFSVTFVADRNEYVVTIGNFRRNMPNLFFVDNVKLIELDKLPAEFASKAFALPTIPSAPEKAVRHTTLLAHFDKEGFDTKRPESQKLDRFNPLRRPNADYARWNPLSAGRDVSLVGEGRFGKAASIIEPRACVIFGGEDNCPMAAGTVEMFLRSATGNIWADGKEHWFVYLHRSRINDFAGHGGFSLELFKDGRNRLVLTCGRGRRIALDVSALRAGDWHHLLFGWDVAKHRMYLTVDGQGSSTAIPSPLRAGEFSAILLGNHPTQNLPAGCLLDELAISARPPTDRSPDTGPPIQPKPLPQPGRFKSALDGKGLEKTGLDAAMLLKTERRVRKWLDWVLRSQHGGGWSTTIDNVRWPSLLCGGYGRLCGPRGEVTFGKAANTSHTAMHVCFAYQTFGDPRYLQAVRRTAEMCLKIQQTTDINPIGAVGWWPKVAYVTPDGTIPGHGLDRVMIQDFYVTGPTLTLLYVHKLTGEARYLAGAVRGGNFLLMAQNPNGSWPHHYDWNRKAGYGTGSPNGPGGGQVLNGAELNDNATTDAMRTLVALWHWTKDDRYLTAVRRAADWVVEAQLDGPTFGWAAQYDSKNIPVWARAHEPPAAVWGNGALMATNALFLAHRLTGDEKYLKPVDRYLAALDKIRTPEGWYQTYDYKNGRPIAARAGKIYFLDDPKQVKAYHAAGSGSAGYWKRGAMRPEDYESIKRRLLAARRGESLPRIPNLSDRKDLVPVLKQEMTNSDLHRVVDLLAARRWFPEEGLWMSTSNKFAAGPAFCPCHERPVRYTLRVCHLARAILGEVELDQVFPLGGEIMDLRYHVIPKPGEFFNTRMRGRSGSR